MKLSTRARYAMRMMVAIARETNSRPAVSLNSVSKVTGISRRYLEQLAIAMKSASLIRGTTGRGGGYRLTQSTEEIKLEKIIEAAIGPINIVECVLCPETCQESNTCECRWVYHTINERISGVFKELSLDDLVDQPIMLGPPVDGSPGAVGCSTAKNADWKDPVGV